MRDLKKFKQDEKNGLFMKRVKAGTKGLTTTMVSSAISRAVRRGRISKDTAKRCSSNWSHELCNRPKSLIWSLVATTQLLEVAKLRKQGKVELAKIVLKEVKNATMLSKTIEAQ